MSKVLQRKVFVLNRLWQLVNETSVEEALKQMAAGAVTGLDFRGDDDYVPTSWENWLKLPPLSETDVVHTQYLKVRMPTVIVAVRYDRIPKRRPKLTLKNIAKRDNYTCQYTGKKLKSSELSMDHIDPLSRGGKNEPDNIALADKKFNSWKSDRTPEELGIPRPKVKKLGVFRPEPSHPHHEKFQY
jgi:5-methylcytosine-specific restriction endonuclease McrA